MAEPTVTHIDREAELTILYEIASISKQAHDLDAVIDLTLDKATRLLGAEIALFYLYDAADDCLHARGARGVRLNKVTTTLSLVDGDVDLSAQPSVWSAAESVSRTADPLRGQYPIQAQLGLPVCHASTKLGWLYVARLKRFSFERQEVVLYGLLVDQVVSALEITLAWKHNQQQQVILSEANQRLEQVIAEMTRASQRQEQLIQTITALSAPVLTIDHHMLLIPLIGHIDEERSHLIEQRMLDAVSQRHARIAILDITGIAMVDERVIRTLIETARAAQLLGTSVIACGISPEVAQVIVGSGFELPIPTTHNLATAMAMAFRMDRR